MTTVYRVTMKDGKAFSMLDPDNKPSKQAAAGIVARFGRDRIESIKRVSRG